MNIKAILEFNLEDPEAKRSHIRAVKADMAYSALHRISEDIFRRYRKYGLPKVTENMDKEQLLDWLEDEVRTTISEAGIDLHEEY